MKSIIVICLSLLISFNAFSVEALKSGKVESKSTTEVCISGTILDKLTGEALAGVEVKLLGTEVKVYSDLDGKFEIKNINSGAHAIQVDFISYENVVENVFVNKDNTTNVTLKLKNVVK